MSRTRAPTYLVHDLNMNGLISVFSQKIKTVQNSKRLFSVFSMYTRPPRPTILSLEELDSAATFPAEVIHNPTAVEKRVMNERRSRLPSLSLLHTIRRMFNIQIHYTLSLSARLSRYSKRIDTSHYIFSVAALLNPCPAHSSLTCYTS